MKLYKYIYAIVFICLLLFVWLIYRSCNPQISVDSNKKIDITPEQIIAIRDIGQWEFLAVTDEEIVDTVRKGIFSDDHLARIYYGTLRLGIDLRQLSDKAFITHGDTLIATMPKIMLLDEHFIDEARTRSFYESGHWQANDREAMFQRAHRQMLQHAYTPQNIQAAKKNGEEQIQIFLQAVGFRNVIIHFEDN